MRFSALVIFMLTAVLRNSAARAQASPSAADSMVWQLQATWIDCDFARAGCFYKMDKYHLGTHDGIPADSVFYPAVARYQKLFQEAAANHRPVLFPLSFYHRAIPVAQYFRNAGVVALLMEHSAQLHPKPAAADPKHHPAADGQPGHNHSSHSE